MALLFESREATLAVTLLIGCFFFLVEWILTQPSIWKAILRPILKLGGSEDLKTDDAFHRGLRFRFVCAVHNTPQSVLAVYASLSETLWEDSLHGTSLLSQAVIVFSCGFFIWDIPNAIKFSKKEGHLPVLHGVVCFSFLLYTLLTDNCHFYGCASIVWEISTPFVHFRWLLSKMGMQQTRLFFNNGMVMLTSYALCRICWGTYVAFKFFSAIQAMTDERIDFSTVCLLSGFCLSGNLLNYFWFWKILSIAKRYIMSRHPNGSVPKNITKEE